MSDDPEPHEPSRGDGGASGGRPADPGPGALPDPPTAPEAPAHDGLWQHGDRPALWPPYSAPGGVPTGPDAGGPALWATPGGADQPAAGGPRGWPPPGGTPPSWPVPPPGGSFGGWPPLGGPPDPWSQPPGWWEVRPPSYASRWRRLQILALSGVIVIVAAIGVAIGRTSLNGQAPGSSPFGSPSGSPGDSPAPAAVPNIGLIAQKVDPAVVDVTTKLGFANGAAAGTGMVLGPTGEVLTNNHVIAGATSIDAIDVGNGRTYRATVVGTDKADDIAVLQLSGASGLKTVTLGASSTLGVGQVVTAVGNAGGRGGTPSVAAGTVTALNQPITALDESDNSSEQLTGLVQTDAALQPGDSGGPLVNSQGDVVGIDTAASTGFQFQSGSSEGFAIPIDEAVTIARQIEAGMSSAKVHIGPAAFLGVEVHGDPSTSGAVVARVEPGSPAERAGLVNGDAIVVLGGDAIDSPTTLTNVMQRHHPGDRVTVTWVDQSNQQSSATVVLATGPAT